VTLPTEQQSTAGTYAWIFPSVVLINITHPPSTYREETTIQDLAVIATISMVLPCVVEDGGRFCVQSAPKNIAPLM